MEEITLNGAVEELPVQEQEEARDECEELRAALLEANIRLALLMAGTAKEKLSEAAKLAEGLCAAGVEPAAAAEEVINGYPHLRAVQHTLPQFSAAGGGKDDGFALIRSIFARK